MASPQACVAVIFFSRTLFAGVVESISFAPATHLGFSISVTLMYVAGLSSRRGRKSPERSKPPKYGACSFEWQAAVHLAVSAAVTHAGVAGTPPVLDVPPVDVVPPVAAGLPPVAAGLPPVVAAVPPVEDVPPVAAAVPPVLTVAGSADVPQPQIVIKVTESSPNPPPRRFFRLRALKFGENRVLG
jgi:hypothetical protein